MVKVMFFGRANLLNGLVFLSAAVFRRQRTKAKAPEFPTARPSDMETGVGFLTAGG